MASNEGADGVQTDIPEGHTAKYSIRYPNFAGSLPFYVEKKVNFFCHVTPSSWRFRVALKVAPTDGSVSFTITVNRTDDSRGVLDVEMWTKAFAFPIHRLPPVTYDIPGMSRGGEASQTFDGIISKEKLEEMGDQLALFQVFFCVKGCHVDNDLARLRKRQKAAKADRGWKALSAKM